jgi:hypothetical protein
MLPLALLASHLVGDFVFQTRWQAAGKFGWTAAAARLRIAHVATYMAAFVPVWVWGVYHASHVRAALLFLPALGLLHFLTDSRRFLSTLGDVIAWRGFDSIHREIEARNYYGLMRGPESARRLPDGWYRFPPPNPWPTIPLAIDQTLHVVQLAALGWLLT